MISYNLADYFQGFKVVVTTTSSESWEGDLVAHHPDTLHVQTQSLGVVVVNWRHVVSVRRRIA